MHDVLVHYLEVNFPEIAEQLAHARARDPSNEERAAAAERLRELIRRLRRGTAESGAAWHEPRASAAEMIAGVNGELSPDEREVLDHFFELFARSMERTQAAKRPEPTAAAEAPVEPVAVTLAAPEAATEPFAVTTSAVEAPSEALAAPPAPEPSPEPAPAATAAPPPEPPAAAEREPAVEPAAPEPPTQAAPPSAELPAARLVPEQMAGYLQTILLAAAQQALDLLQVDASQVYTLGEQRRFVLRAGVPTESLAAPEGVASISSGLLRKALEHNEVFTVEDLANEELTPDESAWVDAGYRGFAAIALSPPLERPIGVLALLRRTPWRLDRRDAVRLEDLAVEAVAALRAHSLASKVAEVAVLQERLNLAREIHDGLASDLAAVVALFKYYEQRRERDPQDASQLLPQLRSMSEEILAGARNILQSLRPKTIRSEGLLASLLKLVDQFGRVNLVETNVNIRGEENAIAAEQKEVIFQVLRESLSNVRKHSRARNLWVVLDLSSAPWVMTVRDDGRGFDVHRVAEDPRKVGSYGLVGMRERAELMGGTLEIVSQALEGTVVTLIGPADRAE
ncbi:MAG TPA: GAF domain-containing sensor histidine kinase [Candidatus Dormibacteraeota bacterium]|nr:GAF domain-containing sensor histidine kinase [Candidatus Dormibacteraeota bacterium]